MDMHFEPPKQFVLLRNTAAPIQGLTRADNEGSRWIGEVGSDFNQKIEVMMTLGW